MFEGDLMRLDPQMVTRAGLAALLTLQLEVATVAN